MSIRTVKVGQLWSYQFMTEPATSVYEVTGISEEGLFLGDCSIAVTVVSTSHSRSKVGQEYGLLLNVGDWNLEQDSDGEVLWEGAPDDAR